MSTSSQPSETLPSFSLPGNSLLELDLVRIAFSDPAVRWVERRVDANWHYAEIIPQSLVGFDPVAGSIFFAASSATAAWIATPNANPRLFNEKDRLVREVLMATHDYLHNFAYRAIQQRRPDLAFGVGAITRENFETHVFLHLLTEAVATVGLDYWLLCTIHLDRVLAIGTRTRSLTVSYHQDDEAEYGLFDEGFTAQTPDFLAQLCTFYCTGEFLGFSLEDALHSARLFDWLSHEISYGAKQRSYTRQWFQYQSTESFEIDQRALEQPVGCTEPWQQSLVTEVATDLWALVKEARPAYWGIPCARAPARGDRRVPDFRFENIGAFDLEQLAAEIAGGRHTQRNGVFAVDQYLSSFIFSAMAPELRAVMREIRKRGDLQLAMQLLSNEHRLPERAEQRDIFLLA